MARSRSALLTLAAIAALAAAIGGGDLSRPALVQAMVRSEEEWDAVASFCEAVMVAKEVAERERERTSQRPAEGAEGAPGVGGHVMASGHRRRGPVDGCCVCAPQGSVQGGVQGGAQVPPGVPHSTAPPAGVGGIRRFSQYSRGRGYRDWRTRGDPTLINSLWRSRQPLGIRKQLGNAEVYIILALLIGFVTVVVGCWLSDNCWSPEPEDVLAGG